MTASFRPELDTIADSCPKLVALGGRPHVVTDTPREVGGRLKARCRYCSRTIDLGPAVVPGQVALPLDELRSCAVCGTSIAGLRPQATTCSAGCRQKLARSRRPAPVVVERACRYCRQPVRGRALTCSSRCRSAMYRSRQGALDTTFRTRLSADDLYRLQAAHGPDAPAPMRVAGSSFWACRCGLVVRDELATCGFCAGARPPRTLLEVLA